MKIVYTFLLLLPTTLSKDTHLDGSTPQMDLSTQRFIVEPFTRQQINCLQMRSTIPQYPIFQTVDFGIKGIFKKNPKRQFTSYRNIAKEMIESYVFSPEDIKNEKLEGFLGIFDQLVEKKGKYAEMFMNLDQNKFRPEGKKIVKLEFEKEQLQKKLASSVDALNAQRAKVLGLFDFVQGTPSEWANAPLGKSIKNLNLLKELKFRIELPYQDEEFTQTLANMTQEFAELAGLDDILQNIADLNIQIEDWEGLKEMVNLYGDVLTTYPQQGALPGDLKDVTVDVMDIEAVISSLKKARESKIKHFKNPISQKIKQIKEQIKQDNNFQTYKTNVKKFKEEKKQLEKDKLKVDQINSKIEVINGKLESLQIKTNSTFTVARDTAIILEDSITQFQKSTDFFNQIPVDPKDKLHKTYEKYAKKYAKFPAQPTFLTNNMTLMQKKLALIQEINQLDNIIDSLLGKLFAWMQYHLDGQECFSLAYLSYIIFGLVKTNAIINESEFFKGFFRSIDYSKAKEFIVHNNGLFTGTEFIHKQFILDDFKESLQLQQKRCRSMLIDMYIKSWSFLITAFKEFTKFGIKSENGELKKVGIRRRMTCILKSSLLIVFDLTTDVTMSKLIDLLVGEIFKVIPILGNIPFLSTILSAVLAKILNYIIGLLVQRFGLDKVSMGDVWQKMKVFYRNLKKKEHLLTKLHRLFGR